jgi:uncharacterized protein (DUF58 family)
MLDQSQILNIGNLELLARQVVEGFITGMHKSPFHGFSVEFAEHRQYNPGESTRHLDWKLFGRTERLYVKKYEEETNLRCHILLDSSASMFYPAEGMSKLRFSVYAAASVMHLLKKQRDAIGLSVFSNKLIYQSDTRSAPSHHRMMLSKLEEILESQPIPSETNLVDILHEIAEKMHRRSMIIIFSDMFENTEQYEPLFAALQHLKYNKHEVMLFHTAHHGRELDFEFDNRPYQFVDVETGAKVKLFPHEIKKQYQEKMGAFFKELKYRCTQYQIDFVEADVAKDFDQILLPFLVKRQRFRS